MLLGGSRYALPVIETAHKLGLYVITCDYLPDNIAHKYSDQYCNVSIIDKYAVLKVAQELQIDGIMSFACDPGVVTAAYVAEKMGLPSCGSYETVSILQNKARFRRFLTDNGFNVPKIHSYNSVEDAIREKDIIEYPVIVKPVDSAGSKGVTRVNSSDELFAAVEHAFDYSLGSQIIIEDYLEKVGYSSDTDCFSVDGKLRFVSFNSQRFDESSDNPYAPAAFSWPSSMPSEVELELTNEIQRVITLLNLGNSIYNVETRLATNGKPYIMEISPRGGGNRLAECLRYATGVDLIEGAVRAALGMPIENITQQPYSGHWAEVVLHSENNGAFRGLWISDAIKDCVVEKDLWVQEGDKVFGFDSANKAIGTLVLKFKDQASLDNVMNHISEYVKVRTEESDLWKLEVISV